MCRLLWIRSEDPFEIASHLHQFASLAQASPEYQGHGWGCARLHHNGWQYYRNINPVWLDDLNQFGKTTLFLAHARSAFRDEGITVENNMPFSKDNEAFIFNGELSGVRIRQAGRIGAEKIFHFIDRFRHLGPLRALEKAVEVIEKRSRYIRAMNMILATPEQSLLASLYNENEGYFQMYRHCTEGMTIVCSQPYPSVQDWNPIENRTIQLL